MKPSSNKNTSVFPQGHIDRSNWKRVMLGEVLSLSDGDWIESKDQSSSGFRLIQTGNIGEGAFEAHAERARFIPTETFNRLKCTEVFPGDCLISRLPDPIGRACILPDIKTRMITAVDCAIARPVDNKIDMRFFVYYTSTSDYKGQMERGLMGSTRQRISRRNLNEVVISLPDIKIQKEIVASFTAIDTQISSVQFLLNKYEAIKKATVNLLLKPKGNWPVVALGTICEVCSTRRVHESDWTSTGVPFYRARELVALNEGREISPLHISEKLYAECVASSGEIQAGDLLVTGVGSIGVPYLVKRGDRFYFKDGNVIWFKNRGKLHPKYFLHVFKSEYIQDQIEEMSCVGTVGSYTITNGKQTLIPLPPVWEQEQTVTILDSIDKTLKSLKVQLEKSQAIKQGMMTYFFG